MKKIRTIWNTCISLPTKNQTPTCQHSFPSSCNQVMKVLPSSASYWIQLTKRTVFCPICLYIHPNTTHGISIPFTDSVLQWSPSRHRNCDATTTQNSPVLFCTGLRNNILFHLTATSSCKCKIHSQNTLFFKSEQCCKNSTSLASLCCNERNNSVL